MPKTLKQKIVEILDKDTLEEYLNKKANEILKAVEEKEDCQHTFSEIILKILPELEKEVKEFRKEVKRLEDINSPIQMLDTSKNFFIILKDKYIKK